MLYYCRILSYLYLFRYRIYQRRYLGLMIAGTWITAFSIMIPTWRGLWGRFGLDTSIGSCSILQDENGHTPKEFLFIAAFIVPCICIVVCYARILYLVRKAAFTRRSREYPTKPNVVQHEIPPPRQICMDEDKSFKAGIKAESLPEIKPFDVYEDLEYIDVSDSNDNAQELAHEVIGTKSNCTNLNNEFNAAYENRVSDFLKYLYNMKKTNRTLF